MLDSAFIEGIWFAVLFILVTVLLTYMFIAWGPLTGGFFAILCLPAAGMMQEILDDHRSAN